MSRRDAKYFTVKFELKLEPWQKVHIDEKMRIMRIIYNALNKKIRRIYHYMTTLKSYKEAEAKGKKELQKYIKNYRHEFRNNKGEILMYTHKDEVTGIVTSEIPKFFTAFVFNSYAAKFLPSYTMCGINSMDLEFIANSLWQAWEKYLFSNGKKINHCEEINHYKSRLIKKHNKSYYCGFDDYFVKSEHKLGIKLKNGKTIYVPFKFNINNIYECHAMTLPIRTIGIQRIEIRNKIRYYVVFGMEGIPYNKGRKLGTGRVGIDLGPSTAAVVSKDNVTLIELAHGIEIDHLRVRYLMRQLDRLRRINNPWLYNEDGTIKKIPKDKRPKMVISRRYKKLKHELRVKSRSTAAKRKIKHNILANELLSWGDTFIVENNNFKAMQRRAKEDKVDDKGKHLSKKRFGKSIGNHAPAAFASILENKVKALDGEFYRVDTGIAATQFDFTDCSFTKRTLKEKRVTLSDGITHQRDIMAAYNLMHAKVDLLISKTGKPKKATKSKDNYDVEGLYNDYHRFRQLEYKAIKKLESVYGTTRRKYW